MKEKRFSRLHLILAAVLGAVFAVFALCLAAWLFVGPHVLSFLEAWGMARTQFVGDYEPDRALDGALYGLVAGLGDQWSYYLTAEGFAAQNQRRTNSYVGVGITVSYEDERGLLIREVKEGAPAAGAGLLPGEIIAAVDGTSLAGEARYNGADLIMGEAGTKVTLTVLSQAGESRQVELERAAVPTEPVHTQMTEDQVGYVRLDNFYSHSAEKLSAAVDELVEQGARALVFDMRNNGGGYVKELTDMLDHLLPEGPIFRTESKRGREEVVQSDEGCVDIPMAVLVNGGTYSAAEFFAAQLQETAGAELVGEETSGKGYSQQAIPLPNGGALNLSTARYRTGAGVSLVGTGVSLDREVPLSEEEAQALESGTLSLEEDPQFQAALALLK